MSSLFEITGDLLRLMDMLEDPEQEVDEEAFLDTWEGMEGEFNDKVESWLKVIRNKEADIEARKKLVEDLTKKNKRDENTITRMKDTIAWLMKVGGKKTAGTEILSASIRKKGGPLPILYADCIKEDPLQLPKEYVLGVTTYKPNTEKIRKALDDGIQIPGVAYGERGEYLAIK